MWCSARRDPPPSPRGRGTATTRAREGAVTYLDGVADRMAAGEGSRLSPELTARYRDRGQWRDVDVARYLADALQQAPDRPAAVGLDGNGDLVRRLTYSELDDLQPPIGNRTARARRGVRRHRVGDAVEPGRVPRPGVRDRPPRRRVLRDTGHLRPPRGRLHARPRPDQGPGRRREPWASGPRRGRPPGPRGQPARRARRRPGRGRAHRAGVDDVRRAGRPSPHRGRTAGGPGTDCLHRVHVGYHQRTQGGCAPPPDGRRPGPGLAGAPGPG